MLDKCKFCGSAPKHDPDCETGPVWCRNRSCPINCIAFTVKEWNMRPTVSGIREVFNEMKAKGLLA